MKKLICTLLIIAMSVPYSRVAYTADPIRGKLLVKRGNCIACHGLNMNAPILPEYPKLAGQYADYLYAAMRAYQIGDSNPLVGRDSLVMSAQLQNLSESDLRDIAAYLESLPGSLVDKR